MIRGDQCDKEPSEHIKKRSAKMRAKLVRQLLEGELWEAEQITEVEVKPDVRGKATRIVSFHKKKTGLEIECFDKKTLTLCDANRYRRRCSHVHTAIEMLINKWTETKGVNDESEQK